MFVNTAKRRMLEGKPALGGAATLGSPLAAEILAGAGFDFVMIDDQHGIWEPEAILAAFRSIYMGGSIPMARVQKNDFGLIGALLDKGALGIIVPMVNSVEDAKAAAYAMRYPPRGGRSIGAYGYRMYGPDYEDYQRTSNEEVFLAVQIESKRAAERAEEILAVDGVDGCWIGPADLAASMVLDLSNPRDAEVHKATILGILDACKKTGKIPGIAAGSNNRMWIEHGFLFVTVGSDSGYISSGALDTVRALRNVR